MRTFSPERIVCLTEETVETLHLLGEDRRIAGRSGRKGAKEAVHMVSYTLPEKWNPFFRSVRYMSFKDDECRIGTNTAPENFATLKHMAANSARKPPGRDYVRLHLKTVA